MSQRQRLITKLTNTLLPEIKANYYLNIIKREEDSSAQHMLLDLLEELDFQHPNAGIKKALNNVKNKKPYQIGKHVFIAPDQNHNQSSRVIIDNQIKELLFENALEEINRITKNNPTPDYDSNLVKIYMGMLDFRSALKYAINSDNLEVEFLCSYASGDYARTVSLIDRMLPLLQADKVKYATVYEFVHIMCLATLAIDSPIKAVELFSKLQNTYTKFEFFKLNKLFTDISCHNFESYFNQMDTFESFFLDSIYSAPVASDLISRIKISLFSSILNNFGRVTFDELEKITHLVYPDIQMLARQSIRNGLVFGKIDLINNEFINENPDSQKINRDVRDKVQVIIEKMKFAQWERMVKLSQQ